MADDYQKRLLSFIASEEGFRDRTYKDTKGIATIGYGFNLSDAGVQAALRAQGHNPDALRAGRGTLTRDAADRVLTKLLPVYEQAVDKKVGSVKLSPNQRIALVSLVYNGGEKMIGPKLTAAVQKGDWTAAAHEIRENSNQDLELTPRRKREAAMFIGGEDPLATVAQAGPVAGGPPTGLVPFPGGASPSGLTPFRESLAPNRDNPALHEDDPIGDGTALGRIFGAIGRGVADGWGERPLGFSKATEEALGITPEIIGQSGPILGTLRAFNRALLTPPAVALDGLLRGVGAAVEGAALGIGQLVPELGGTETSGRKLARDINLLAQTVGVVAPMAPAGPRVPKAPRAGSKAEPPLLGGSQPPPPPPGRGVGPAIEPPPGGGAGAAKGGRNPFPENEVIDKAGNINLERINAGEDVLHVIRRTAEGNQDFIGARRGVMTLEDTKALAFEMGMTPEALLKRRVGDAFNAEQATAARTLLVQSASDVKTAAQIVHAGGTEKDMVTFLQRLTRHQAIQEQVAGMTAEAGRALSAFRIQAADLRLDPQVVLSAGGGAEHLRIAAKAIAQAPNTGAVSKVALAARSGSGGDMLIEAWRSFLLSGPQTHVVNTLSNALTATMTLPETAIAAGIGKARQALGSTAPAVQIGEVQARTFGLVKGMRDGIVAGYQAFKTETPVSLTMSPLEMAKRNAIPSIDTGFKYPKLGPVGGSNVEIGGKQLRIPLRALAAEDEFFKAISYHAELNALAYRQASAEGLTGLTHSRRIAQLVDTPAEDMIEAARKSSEYVTFNNPLGVTGQAVQQFTRSNVPAQFIIPFVRTPTNIMKYAAERTPFGLLFKEVRANLAGNNGAIARDIQLSRLAIGAMIGGTVAGLALEGSITGAGPTDPAENAVLRLSGWQPYSVRVGDTYYAYNRMDPFALVMGIAADGVLLSTTMSDADAEKVGALLVTSISNNLVSKTWLRNASELTQAIADPDRYGETWIKSLTGTAVPTLLAQITRTEDPILRETETIVDTWRSRIPGLSKDLLPKRDIWGEPLQREGGLGPDLITPFYISTLKNDPATMELVALKVFPAKVSKTLQGIELKPELYDELSATSGRLTKTILDGLVSTPNWHSLPEFARREAVANTINSTREAARQRLLATHPELLKEILETRVKEITGKKP